MKVRRLAATVAATVFLSGLGVFVASTPAFAATCTGTYSELELFTSANTAGSCWAARNLAVSQCVNVPAPYDNNASSFWNVFPSNQTWAIYKGYNCTGEISYQNPEVIGNLTGSWNNEVSSVKRLV